MTAPGARAAAAAAGLARYFTGAPCRAGHISERFTSGGQCVTCNHQRSRAWQVSNPEKISERWAEYHSENREQLCVKKRAYEAANRTAVRARKSEYMRRNWHRFKRKIKRATPRCLTAEDNAAIRSFYEDAKRRTEDTGSPHEVDHIVPLLGRKMCGLHVPWNLRVMTQFDNRSKGNRYAE